MNGRGEPAMRDEDEDAPRTPLLTVVVPTFRREVQVVAAVRSALAAGIDNVEVLVYDDSPEGSARANVERIGDDRVVYLQNPEPTGGKPAIVRNMALGRARGTYLYFLDDDDEAFPGSLARMVDALERHPDKGVALGTVRCIGPDAAIVASYNEWFGWAARTARSVRRSSRLTVAVTLFRGTLMINSCCVIRADKARAIGGYDATIPVYEDVDFFTRAIRRYGHVFVDHPVLQYRTGEPSIIHDLHGDTDPIHQSYEIIHGKYRATHGTLDYRLMQVLGRLVPAGRHAPEAPQPAH